MLKKILVGLVAIFIVIQFFRSTKNDSSAVTNPMSAKYPMSPEVETIFKDACYNCHSNKTEYPWYAEVQPVAWWLANHVNEGKQHLNFDEFTSRRIAYQNHKLEEIGEMVEKKEMPLPSYTWLGLHPEARLSEAQRELIIQWTKIQMDTLAQQYPADSLVIKRRQ